MSERDRRPQQATPQKPEYNAGDEEQVNARKAQSKARQQRVEAGLAIVMSNADARMWLASLLEDMAPFQETFTGNSETFYRCGKQSLGKRLVAQLLDKHLDEYVLMMKESKNAA